MLVELLEKFEDVFKPISPEELDKRIPKDAVRLITNLYYSGTYCKFSNIENDQSYFELALLGDIFVPTHYSNAYLNAEYYDFESLKGDLHVDLEPEWYEPYHKITKESFEDIFQPLSPKELEKRKPTFDVFLYSCDWNENLTHDEGMLSQMQFDIKSRHSTTAAADVAKTLGIEMSRMRTTQYFDKNIYLNRVVKLEKSNNVIGVRNKPLEGYYVIRIR